MVDVPSVKVVGRFGMTAADGVDADDEPDVIWCDSGTVRLRPLNSYTKVAGGTPSPWTAGHSIIEVPLDSEGYLTWSGARYIRVLDLTSPAVNPVIPANKATHSVEFKGIKAGGTIVSFDSVNVRLAADTVDPLTGVCDLTKLMPVPTAGGTPITRGEQGTGIASIALAPDGTGLVATMTDGTTKATALPAALVESDAQVAAAVTGTGAARAAMEAVIGAKLPPLVIEALAADGVPAAAAASAVAAAVSEEPSLNVASKRGRWPVVAIVTNGAAPILDTETYVAGSYVITDTDAAIIHSGGLRIRGRGNSTWTRPKKPYRLNFDVATAPLGMKANQRNWALLANDYDPGKVNNHFALSLGQGMTGLAWTPEYRVVEVTLNGDYLGLYQLADLVRMEAGRVAGPEADSDAGEPLTGAYLLEISNKEAPGQAAATGEPGWRTSKGVWIFYDTPEAPTAAQQNYIQGYVNSFEAALFDSNFMHPTAGWRAYAEETAFADWYIVNELTGNSDSAFWSSCKLHKPRNGKLAMGPLWDFDLSLGVSGNATLTPTDAWRTRNAVWYARLFDDSAFVELVAARWLRAVERLTEMGTDAGFIDRLVDQSEPAVSRDDRRWSRVTYAPQQAHVRKAWLAHRKNWLAARLTANPDRFPATFATTF